MRTLRYIFCFFVLFLCVEGCALKKAPTEMRNLPTDTPTPIYTQETMLPTQPPEETPFNTQEAELLIQPSGKVIYDSSYLQDCRSQFPTKNDLQVGLENVYPGVTTVPDMVAQFGQSYEYSEDNQGGSYYIYTNKEAGYVYNFRAENNIIEHVRVDNPEIVVPLKDILNKYGCSDLMVAVALENDIPGAPIIFNGVSFTYLNAGLLIRFNEYPIEYSSIPDVFLFMNPTYLKETEFVNNEYAVLASFSEAVIDK